MGRLGSILTLTRSRDSDDGNKRKWGNRRSSGGSEKGGPIIPASALFADHEYSANGAIAGSELVEGGRSIPAAALFTDYASTSIPGPSILSRPAPIPADIPVEDHQEDHIVLPDHVSHAFEPRAVQVKRRPQLPYTPMKKPQPAPSYRLYPNYTPLSPRAAAPSLSAGTSAGSGLYDRRQEYDVTEDDYAGYSWANRHGEDGEEEDEGDGRWRKGERVVEWDKEDGVRKRWVGPIM